MESVNLSALDIGIMVLYAVLIIGYGLYHGKQKSSEEYFLAGKNMTWPIVGISLFAANISSSTLIGLAGSAYNQDLTVYNYEWYAVIVLIFFALFFLPFYLRTGVYTMPEFLEMRYDARSRYYFSAITVIGNILIDTAAALYVGMIVLNLLFPTLPPWVVIVLLAIAAAAYTIPGGLNSVIQTEVIQAVILILGSCILTYFALDKIGGWDAMVDKLNTMYAEGQVTKSAEDTLSIVQAPNSPWWKNPGGPIVPWWGLLTGVPLLGFYFWANNQFMVQRILSAKDLNHGRWGALFAGLLKLPVILIMVIPGVLALVLYHNSPDILYQTTTGPCTDLAKCTDYTYPTLLFDLLPTGVLGLVVAGLLAAMMSSVSATFNSASTLITMDFVNKFNPKMSSKQLVRAGQITTAVLVLLASLWAPQIGKYGDLFKYLQDILGYIAPPIVAVFLLGLFWPRANAQGSFYSLMVGALFSLIWVFGIIKGYEGWFFEMHFLLRTTVLFIICMFVHIGVSLATPPPPKVKTDGLIWTRKLFAEETQELKSLPWYLNYRNLAIILGIITTLVVAYFW